MAERIIYDPQCLKVVPINQLRNNSWNPKVLKTPEYEILKRGIEQMGLRFLPVVVRQNNGFEIIDGEQRWRACQELGYVNILIYDAGEVSDKEAQEMTLWYQHQIPVDEAMRAKLLVDLSEKFPESLHVPFTEAQIKDMKAVMAFDWNKGGAASSVEAGEKTISLTFKLDKDQYAQVMKAFDLVKKGEGIDNVFAFMRCIAIVLEKEGSNA